MTDLYQQPDLDAQFKFLGDQFEVINSYSLMLEKELQKVSTTNQWNLQESRSVCWSRQLYWGDQSLWGVVAKDENLAEHQSTNHASKVLWHCSSSTFLNETKGRNLLCSTAWERDSLHMDWTWSGHSETVLSNSKTRLGQTEALEAQTRKHLIMWLCWSFYQIL